MTMRFINKTGFISAVFLASVFSLAPFLWFIASSFKTQTQITAIPPKLWPSLSFDFYRSAISNYGIFTYLLNSLLVAGSTTILTLILGTFAGYALSRLPKKAARIILVAVLSCAMFPQISIAGPIWQFLQMVGWLNSYQGLIIPYVAISLPLVIWILTVFFHEIPRDLEFAALVDGCSRMSALRHVVLPLSAPGLFTASILCFIHAWNEFFLALLIITDPSKQTMPVGIALFQGEHTIPWGEISAASFISTIPLVILVLLFQRRIVSGLSAGAIKG
ncbi:carbohydrate ABC transporter permease [Thermodesulfobacteriota bacterium]